MGVPLLIHQPSYSMLNRWIEKELLATLEEEGVGCITFSPLAQGMLTDKYLKVIPAGSRAAKSNTALDASLLTKETLATSQNSTSLPPPAASPWPRWR